MSAHAFARDERHEKAVRSLAAGYCPHCSRGGFETAKDLDDHVVDCVRGRRRMTPRDRWLRGRRRR